MTTAPGRPAYEGLVELLRGGNIAVLSGAGLSTESGIPDYRGSDGKRRVTPMTYGEFVSSPANRQRYWARSFVGWGWFAGAGPNDGHRAVADLQRLGLVRAIITQNVDGLHQRAGAHDVLELHGSLDLVRCLNCGETTPRAELDGRLQEANPHFEGMAGEIRPDGDVVLPDEAVDGFHSPRCLVCASVVRPRDPWLLIAGDEWISVRASGSRDRHTSGDRDARSKPRRRTGNDPARRAIGRHAEPDRHGSARIGRAGS